MNSSAVISLENVGFTHAGARSPVFSGINLELEKGDRLLVTGSSGSGKSTLLGIMTGLVPRFWAGSLSGSVLLNYERAAVVLQNPEAQLVTPTVREEIAFPLENRGLPARIIASRVEEVLALAGLTVLADRKTRFLSGGEAQRLSLACAIAQEPDILFLDEPTAFLDPANASLFLDRLNDASGASSWVVVEHHTEGFESLVNSAVELSPTGCRGIRVEDACLPFSALAVGLNPLDADVSPSKCRPVTIRFTGARHAYPGMGEIFGGLEGSADPGQVTVIMGASGSGKSTLLKKIAGLLPSAREEIWIGDEDVVRLARRGHGLASRLLVVPQNPEHFFLSESIAREWELSGAEPDSIAFAKKLFFLDLDPSLSPAQLSEGEKRRLTLALAFVDPRPVILLDEPSYGLDRDSFLSLLRSLRWLKRQGRTILLVTHSIDLARLTADRLYVLSGGSWTEARP